jgi:ATP-dependent Clp protease ATP-binding subunit ClpA
MEGGLGFTGGVRPTDEDLDNRIYRTAMEAARRKFTPEFMNRIDKVIVFRPLQRSHLEQILEIELTRVQQRIIASSGEQFVFKCTLSARDFLLREGTDAKYGARHLKRAIERHLVFPLSNLIATHQIGLGDLVTVDFDGEVAKLVFYKEHQGALVGSAEVTRPEAPSMVPASHGVGASRAMARRAQRN